MSVEHDTNRSWSLYQGMNYFSHVKNETQLDKGYMETRCCSISGPI